MTFFDLSGAVPQLREDVKPQAFEFMRNLYGPQEVLTLLRQYCDQAQKALSSSGLPHPYTDSQYDSPPTNISQRSHVDPDLISTTSASTVPSNEICLLAVISSPSAPSPHQALHPDFPHLNLPNSSVPGERDEVFNAPAYVEFTPPSFPTTTIRPMGSSASNVAVAGQPNQYYGQENTINPEQTVLHAHDVTVHEYSSYADITVDLAINTTANAFNAHGGAQQLPGNQAPNHHSYLLPQMKSSSSSLSGWDKRQGQYE